MERFCWLTLVGAWLFVGCGGLKARGHLAGLSVEYHNASYGLAFSLPPSWRDYSIFVQQWEGETYIPALDRVIVREYGPIITLRHPNWRENDRYQDIPILVFSRIQWKDMHDGRFTVGAGGIWEEILHNSRYVFAISSRFNADDSLKGWEEAARAVERNRSVHPNHLNEI